MRPVALLKLAALALYGVVVAVAGPHPQLTFAGQIFWQAVAAAGCASAALAFRRGELFRRAWSLHAIAFSIPVLNRLLSGPDQRWFLGQVPLRPVLDAALGLAVNGASVAGACLFVAAFLRSGLALSGAPWVKGAVYGAVALLALALGLPTLTTAAPALGTASGAALGPAIADAASIAGDILCFVAAAPLIQIALELRGGVLALAWGLVGASNLGWLAYDALVQRAAGSRGREAAAELLFAVACLTVSCAGSAHRRAVQGAPRRLATGEGGAGQGLTVGGA